MTEVSRCRTGAAQTAGPPAYPAPCWHGAPPALRAALRRSTPDDAPDLHAYLSQPAAVEFGPYGVLTAADDEDDPEEQSAQFAGAKGVATNIFRLTPRGWRLWIRHGSPVISDTSDDEELEES